jgi:L-glyceraldehyde 3-phosphate reductase
MLVRWVEDGLLDVLDKNGVGCIAFSSLAQGILTNKYLNGIPVDSRAASGRGNGALEKNVLTQQILGKVHQLNKIAEGRGQKLAQMALGWILKDQRMTSLIIGASKPEQVVDSIQCLMNCNFTADELSTIEEILSQPVEQ